MMKQMAIVTHMLSPIKVKMIGWTLTTFLQVIIGELASKVKWDIMEDQDKLPMV
jgi:hypothetical protein